MSQFAAESSTALKWLVHVPSGPDGAIIEGHLESDPEWRITWTNFPDRQEVVISVPSVDLTPTPAAPVSSTFFGASAGSLSGSLKRRPKISVHVPSQPSTFGQATPPPLPVMFTGPVSTSLHISGCPTDISKPTIHLLSHNAAPTFCIPWADMSQIISSDNLNVEILIVISQWDGWHEVSRGIHTPSIRNFAAFARLLGALDAPGNHDVAFHFPREKCLYADRNVLQRESSYFRTMFRSGFQESGEHEPAAPSRKCVIPFEDSDEDSDAEDDGVKGCSPGELPETAPSIPSPTGGVDPPPVHERSMSKIYVSDALYRTMRAVLYYIYSDHIAFAPLKSLPSLPFGNTRETVIQAYLKTNPVYPTPVSSKSVYALAHKYEISALQVVALHHYKLQITKSNVFTELFSAFCRLYEQPKTLTIEFAINNWGTLKETPEWAKVVEEAKINPDFHYVEVTSRILNRWPR